MFPNLFVSPLISQRHMRALESTARATVLPKCHHSGQHTRCVTHWTELELPFCALRCMKIDLYLHIGVRQGSHTNPQTAFGLEHSYNPALAKQCSFSRCELPSRGLGSLKKIPIHDSTGSPSFTTLKSKAGLGSQHLPLYRYTWRKAAVTILESAQELHVYCIILWAKTKVSFKYSLCFFSLTSWTGTSCICYSNISKAKLFETE